MIELISIVVASMGRDTLRTMLTSIESAQIPQDCAVEIVIADDSVDGAVTRQLAGRPSPLPIRVVPVAAQNVSIARNASIDASRGDWLLMVDDDEYVDPAWIVEHLAAARSFKADVVFGPVYPVYPDSAPEWFRRADPQFHDMGWTNVGHRVDFGQSGNTLIRTSTVRTLGLRFDPAFGRTGGEDNDFFRRMAAHGAHLVVTDRPKAWEPITIDRANVDYVLRRMIRGGRIYARARLRGTSAARHAAFAVDAAVKLVAAGVASLVLRPIDRTRAFRMRMKLFSNYGKLSALAGAKPAFAWMQESA